MYADVEEEDQDKVDPGWAGSGQAGFRGFRGIENTVGMRTHSHKNGGDDDEEEEEGDGDEDEDDDDENTVGMQMNILTQ